VTTEQTQLSRLFDQLMQAPRVKFPRVALARFGLPGKRLEVAENRYVLRFTRGATNCGSVSQGNMIQVSCDTSVM